MRVDQLLPAIRGLFTRGAVITSAVLAPALLASLVGGATLTACASRESARVASAADAEDTEAAEGGDTESERKAERKRKVRAKKRLASLPPNRCDDESIDCMPPSKWVNKLCGGIHPEVALHMFRGGSPWKRLYSRARAPAFNGTGGPSLPDETVAMGEELIALRRNGDTRQSSAGEMSIGDTAGYDLLRWNGSCVTLHDGEFSTKPPRRRKHAHVEWKALGDEVMSALRTDGPVRRAFVARRKECKGATIGRVTKKCVEQEQTLVTAIVDYVRSGGELPEPSERL
jgi:hypothetical protein